MLCRWDWSYGRNTELRKTGGSHDAPKNTAKTTRKKIVSIT
jgi:hypothetical protein